MSNSFRPEFGYNFCIHNTNNKKIKHIIISYRISKNNGLSFSESPLHLLFCRSSPIDSSKAQISLDEKSDFFAVRLVLTSSISFAPA